MPFILSQIRNRILRGGLQENVNERFCLWLFNLKIKFYKPEISLYHLANQNNPVRGCFFFKIKIIFN